MKKPKSILMRVHVEIPVLSSLEFLQLLIWSEKNKSIIIIKKINNFFKKINFYLLLNRCVIFIYKLKIVLTISNYPILKVWKCLKYCEIILNQSNLLSKFHFKTLSDHSFFTPALNIIRISGISSKRFTLEIFSNSINFMYSSTLSNFKFGNILTTSRRVIYPFILKRK